MLDSDIPECNKVTLNDGAVRILPPLPAPPKFKMPKMMPSDLKQLPHTLQLEANFSGDNKMITMWDNIKNSTNEKKNRAEAKTYELFVCTIPDEEEKNEDGDPKPLKWKRIGGKGDFFYFSRTSHIFKTCLATEFLSSARLRISRERETTSSSCAGKIVTAALDRLASSQLQRLLRGNHLRKQRNNQKRNHRLLLNCRTRLRAV